MRKKIEIIKYYCRNGPIQTEKKYTISASRFYKWERIWFEEGLALDKHKGIQKPKQDVNKDKDLLAENKRLRLEKAYLNRLDALVQKREAHEKKNKYASYTEIKRSTF